MRPLRGQCAFVVMDKAATGTNISNSGMYPKMLPGFKTFGYDIPTPIQNVCLITFLVFDK